MILPYDHSRGADAVDLNTLLEQSDFISLHVPLTEQTRYMINSQTINRMKANVVLVNTSRGPVVDTNALYEALKSRRIFAAALDVTDPEPLPQEVRCSSWIIVLSYHIWAAQANRHAIKWLFLPHKNLIAGLKGERLPHCVNPQVYG